MTESKEHLDLKKLAHFVLYREGFNESEIQEEYVLSDCPKRFRVDVVGIHEDEYRPSKNKKIAVELGTANPKKLIQLELFFDKVIHIPYGVQGIEEIKLDQVLRYKTKNEGLYRGIDALKQVIKDKHREISRFKKRNEYSSQVSLVLRKMRIIQSSLVYHKNLYDALEDSKQQVCRYYQEGADKKHKHIEEIYKALFGFDEVPFR